EPIGAKVASLGSREVGTRDRPATRATTMIGTLIRNTDPYQKCPSKKPLATGPSAPAAPVMLAQMAIALGRSLGGKTLMMIESVDGMMNAPAAPMTARHAISCHIAVDNEASPASTRNSTTPS